MKRKVLVLGSTGMIGHQVYRHLEQSGEYELFNFSSKLQNSKSTSYVDPSTFSYFLFQDW